MLLIEVPTHMLCKSISLSHVTYIGLINYNELINSETAIETCSITLKHIDKSFMLQRSKILFACNSNINRYPFVIIYMKCFNVVAGIILLILYFAIKYFVHTQTFFD